MPVVFVDQTRPTEMAPGWTLWSGFPGPVNNNSHWAGPMYIDSLGRVRWYTDCYYIFGQTFPKILSYQCGLTGMQERLKNGNLLIMWSIVGAMVDKVGLTGLVEVSQMGKVVHLWTATKDLPPKFAPLVPPNSTSLDMFVINHEIEEMDNGHWIAVGFEIRTITYCPSFGGPKNVTGNEVVEFGALRKHGMQHF